MTKLVLLSDIEAMIDTMAEAQQYDMGTLMRARPGREQHYWTERVRAAIVAHDALLKYQEVCLGWIGSTFTDKE